MAKAPPGGKAPKPAPKKAAAKTVIDSRKRPPAKKTTTGKGLPPPNLKLAFGGGQTMGEAYGSQDPTVDSSGHPLPGSPGSPLAKGAVDPFAGTPYEGMSPYQIAQKIVNDEIKQQAEAISASMAQQNQYNQNALSVISQLGGQMQAGAGQFATNYNNSLANMPGGGGDPNKAFQGFSAGYQAAQGLINGQNPNQPGGPSQASGNGPQQIAQDASNYTKTAIDTNPFAVLPAAYGRMATMDANLLAANQAQAMTGYSQQIKDLYSGADKAMFDEFAQIKSMFDAANGSVADQQAAAAKAQATAAAGQQKTYQWQYGQAASQARNLTLSTGTLWTVDPVSLRVVQVKDKSGNPVVTVQGNAAGVRANHTRTADALAQARADALQWYRKQTLAQRQKSYQLQKQNAGKLHSAADDVNRAAGYIMLLNPATGKYVFALDPNGNRIKYKASGGGKTGTSPNAPGTPAYIQKFQKQHTDLIAKAQTEYQNLTTQTSSGSKNAKGQKSGHVSFAKMTPAAAKTFLRRKYLPQFIRIANALKSGGQFKSYTARQVADYWLNQLFTG